MAEFTGRVDTGSARIYGPATQSDVADFTDGVFTRAICLNVGGALKVRRPDNTDVTLTLPSGWHPIQAIRIWTTGTSATGITVAF